MESAPSEGKADVGDAVGEEVWKRQAPMRALGRQVDSLQEQLRDYDKALSEQTTNDTELLFAFGGGRGTSAQRGLISSRKGCKW